MSWPAKMSRDLPDAVHRHAGLADERQVVRLPRLEREVVAVRRALVVPGLADERPRDHAADGVLAGEDLAGDAAAVVELLERDRLLVRGDLEDRVGGRVDDPLPRLLVLLAELLDDLRPDAGLLPSTPRAVRCMNGSITSCGKPCGYVGSACGVTMPIISQWPIVVSLPFDRSSSRPATAGAPACGGQPSSGSTLPRPSASRFGQIEPADRARDVPERVGALVAELVGVRQRARARRRRAR